MVTLKSQREIEVMTRAGAIAAATLALVRTMVKPGVTTEELDRAAEEFIRSHPGAKPSFKGLYGFPKSLCISINEEIVHGIPSKKRVLREGNIVSVDVGVHLEGLHADTATTIPVGEIAPRASELLDVTERALSLLFTEHDMEVVFSIAQRIAVLHQGRLIAEGTPAQVRADPEVRRVYLGAAR